jgi:hypothetical protein
MPARMPLVRLPFSRFVAAMFVAGRLNIIAFETPIFKDWDMNGF